MRQVLPIFLLLTIVVDSTFASDYGEAYVEFTFRPPHAYYIFQNSNRTVQFNYTSSFNGTVYLMVKSNDPEIATVSRDDEKLFSPRNSEGSSEAHATVVKNTATETDTRATTMKPIEHVTYRTATMRRTVENNNTIVPNTYSASALFTASVHPITTRGRRKKQKKKRKKVKSDTLLHSNSSDLAYQIKDSSSEDLKLNPSTFTVDGKFLGRTFLEFYIYSNDTDFPQFMRSATNDNYTTFRVRMPDGEEWYKLPYRFPVSVIRKRRAIDKIFTYCIMVIVFLANVGLGCKIDLNLVKETLKKPLAPAIGVFCQFLIMPLLSYFLATSMNFDKNIGLGFFAMGCSPGGGASNFYTLLLDGDVSLSCTMTIVSTVLSFGMIPLWIFTLGQNFLVEGSDVKIPFVNILISLGIMLSAFSIGVLIEHKKKKWSRILVRIIAPLMIIAILIIFVVGVWANLYIFKLYTANMILAGCVLPYGGFLLGAFIAFGCRLSWKRVKTIAVETGIQNTSVPIVLMAFSLPYPEADLAIVAPGAAALFMPIPLWFAIAGRKIWIRCKGYKKLPSDEKETEEKADVNKNGKVKDADSKEFDANGVEVRESII